MSQATSDIPLEVLANAAIALAVPLIIGFFTFKGGAGKTTLATHVATLLARMGHNVLLVDADRQRNCTTFFQEEDGRHPPKEEVEGMDDEEDEDVEPPLSVQEAMESMNTGRLVLPSITGEKLAKDLIPISSDYLQIRRGHDKDTLFTALQDFMNGDPRDIKLTQVQKADYDGKDGRGKMFLLEGANSKEMGVLEKDFQGQGRTRFKILAALRQVLLRAASQVTAAGSGPHAGTFVVVDMGPTNDDVNRNFALSCDIIQPCANPDSYSWSSTTELFTQVLPDWWLWWKKHLKEQQDEEVRLDHRFNATFPSVMPVVAMKYAYNTKARHVRWSDSNFIKAMSDAVNEIKSMLTEIEAAAGPADPAAAGSAADLDVVRMEDCWKDYLEARLKKKDYRRALQTIMQHKLLATKDGEVVIPLMRQFHFMAACHEMGRVLFDVTEQNCWDYYYGQHVERTAAMSKSNAGMYGAIKKEAMTMEAYMTRLANSYVYVLVHLNKVQQQAATPAVATQAAAPQAGGASAEAVSRMATAATATGGAAGAAAGSAPGTAQRDGRVTRAMETQKRRSAAADGAGPSKR